MEQTIDFKCEWCGVKGEITTAIKRPFQCPECGQATYVIWNNDGVWEAKCVSAPIKKRRVKS